jgi:hypothetical protein
MTAPYRIPFDYDATWNRVGTPGWDDPAEGGKHPYYAYDFGFPEGHPIRAARAGTVIDLARDRTGKTPAGGNFVYIRHPDGTVASYAHLKTGEVYVQRGQWVDQGALIGRCGNTGASDAPHLHFQVMIHGASEHEIGPTIPVLFEDAHRAAWRPRHGDVVVSNNTVLRQENWRWCARCQGLFFAGASERTPTLGTCPAGGAHSMARSGSYVLVENTAIPGAQADWRWCAKCRGLFFGGNAGSRCPAGGAHTSAGSGNYSLPYASAAIAGQPSWRWCRKCQGLFFGANRGSRCPAGGAHDGTGSGDYELMQTVPPVTQTGWRFCRRCAGLFFGASPGAVCPAGGAHDPSQSGDYLLLVDPAPVVVAPDWWTNGQTDWRWCGKCQGLFFAGNPGSRCPAGSAHSAAGSARYTLLATADAPGQPDWRWCQQCQGLHFAGAAVSRCPAGGAHVTAGSGDYRLVQV